MNRHKLSDVNVEARTAICSIDGLVKIGTSGIQRGKRTYRCRNKLNATSRTGKYRRKYGLDILIDRPIECELCGGTSKIAYDHCHKTGKFRGWLCMKCNTALGLVNDDIELLNKMINYLS